jgi:hypothetical protein
LVGAAVSQSQAVLTKRYRRRDEWIKKQLRGDVLAMQHHRAAGDGYDELRFKSLGATWLNRKATMAS